MNIILLIIIIVSLTVIMFQSIRYSSLEKRTYEIKDGYLNLAIQKKLIEQRHFLRSEEKDLYKILTEILSDNFIVIPQVHLCDLAEVKVGYLDHDNLYYELKRIIYDYAIFDKEFNPLILIELNGSSHFLKNRISRDSIAENNAKNLKIPFVIIKKEDIFNKKEIKERLFPLLEKNC